jgi:SAM-dependent methyltransferase
MKNTKYSCPTCKNTDILFFYEARNLPVSSSIMFSNQKEAINYPKGNVFLGFCNNCGLISNYHFDSKKIDYSKLIPEEQGSSATFRRFSNKLANRLIETYNIHRKEILEIGCGRGDFLDLLCTLGKNIGVGIDPSKITGKLKNQSSNTLSFIRDFFSKKYSKYIGDLLCCRHTLEHIHNTFEFIKEVRTSIGNKSDHISFFEVPDVIRILKEVAFWDIYFEHCSYFTLGSLARLFRYCKFEVKYLAKDYFDQYLLIDLSPIDKISKKIANEEEEIEFFSEIVHDFSLRSKNKIDEWKKKLSEIKKESKKTIVWGSGSKCVGFMTTLNVTDEIDFIVDINPLRHGLYIAGAGKQIKSPTFLKNYKPDVVIVMNPVYLDEIRSDLANMDLYPEMIACS